MGSRNRPLSSWLSLALILIAALAAVSQCAEIRKMNAHASMTFCEVHVLPRGYNCEEHEVYSDDGYMLRLHRVVLRGSLDKSAWEWLEPKLKHKHKHKKPFPWFKRPPPPPEAAPKYRSPPPGSGRLESPTTSAPPPASFGVGGSPAQNPGAYGPSPSSSFSPRGTGAGGSGAQGSSSYSPPGGFGAPSPSSSFSPPGVVGTYEGSSPPSSSYSPPGEYGAPSPASSVSPPSSGTYGGSTSPTSSYSPPGESGASSPGYSSSPPSTGTYGGGSTSPTSSYSPPTAGGHGAPSPTDSSYSPQVAGTNGGGSSSPTSSYSPPAAGGHGAPSPTDSSYSPPGAGTNGGGSSSPTSSYSPPAAGGYGAPSPAVSNSPPGTATYGGGSTPSTSSYSPPSGIGAPSPSYSNSPPGVDTYGGGSTSPTSAFSPPGAVGGSVYGGSPSSSTYSPQYGSGGPTSSAECPPGLSSTIVAKDDAKAPAEQNGRHTTSDGQEQSRTRTRNAAVVVREPVLLMHHELLSGGSWFTPVSSGNDTLLPFRLAEQGFDVWIGHERATLWSHEHLKLTPNDDAYWNWTWDQHVEHDVPKLLTYISNATSSRVHYVGVSLSAAVGAAAATNAGVASLMRTLTLIAPAVYRGRTTSVFLQAWVQFLSRTAMGMSDEEWRDRRLGAFNFPREFHVDALPLTGPASRLRFAISGPDCCLGPSVVSLTNGWDGVTSYKNLEHFQQAISTDTFQHFDYGSAALNAAAYNGKTTPPTYEPKDIPSDLPMLVVYGGQDLYTPPEGVLEFMGLTQKRPKSVYLPYYAHFDISLSLHRAEDVYGPITAFLQDKYGPEEPYN